MGFAVEVEGICPCDSSVNYDFTCIYLLSICSSQEVDVQTSNFELRLQTGHDGVGCGVWGVSQFENVPFRRAFIEEYSFTDTDVYLSDTTTS
jgi:hypothetical protein